MTNPSAKVIGQRVPKLDASAKATGKATYGHDIRLPGMLHGRILYSRYPHAKVVHIDTSRAKHLRGVKCILTAVDNPSHLFGYGKDNKPFKDIARSLRDEIAGVVAIDPDIAEEALELIDVEYEPLPAIFSPKEALVEGAPLIHSERKSKSNLFHSYNYAHGELEQGERESDVVVEANYIFPYVTHACMETSVVVAQFDLRDHLTLWSTTQIPFLLQRDLSEALGISGSQIRIIQTTVGGAFGRGLERIGWLPECLGSRLPWR